MNLIINEFKQTLSLCFLDTFIRVLVLLMGMHSIKFSLDIYLNKKRVKYE